MYYSSHYLSKKEWTQLLNDEEIFNDLAIELLSILIYHFNGCAAASEISDYSGRSYQAYNRVAQRVVEKARKKGYYFPIKYNKKKKERYWIHLFNGKREGHLFKWVIDSELREAFVAVYPESEFEAIFKKTSIKGEIEGKVRLVRHRRLERSYKLVKEAKRLYSERFPDQPCGICGFSFIRTYGITYIEAHHKVSLIKGGVRRTTIEDFAMLCANCHRMAHSSEWREKRYEDFKRSVQKQLKMD